MPLDFLILTELVNDDLPGWRPVGASADGRYVLSESENIYQNFWMLDRSDDSVTSYVNPAGYNVINSCAVDDDGSVYFVAFTDPSSIYHWVTLSAPPPITPIFEVPSSSSTIGGSLRLCVMPDSSKKLVWLLIDNQDEPNRIIWVYDIDSGVGTGYNWYAGTPQGVIQDSYGDVWVFGRVDASSVQFSRVVNGGAGVSEVDTATAAIPYDVNQEFQALHTSAGWFICANGGKDLYLLDDTDFSILDHRSYATSGSGMNNWGWGSGLPSFLMVEAGLDEIWFPGPNSFDNWNVSQTVTDICRINAADLSTLETLDVHDWVIDDVPGYNSPPIMYSSYEPKALISMSYEAPSEDPPTVVNYTPVIRYLPASAGPGVTDDDIRLRVWTFSLDGHDYFVLRIGITETLVYDLTTSQWSHWASPSEEIWRAHVGQNWIGIGPTTVARGFGTDIVAGDDRTGILWMLDPSVGLDDDPVDGQPAVAFERKVTGGIQLSGRETRPCGAIQLTTAMGNPQETGASYTLRISDDHGNSWINCGSVATVAGNYRTVVEWRGLGLMKAPGRVFEVSDSGASVRLSRLDLR